MSLLTCENLTKFYGRQDVLRGASMFINSGERVGLIGANGAGKTTLIRMILGRETPDDGQVHMAKGLRLGFLPQDLMTFSGQSLLEMVMDTAAAIRDVQNELEQINQDIEELSAAPGHDRNALLELTNRQGHLMELFENLGGYTLEPEARKILTGLGFNETDLHRRVEEFSGGWIMRAVLARLLVAEPDLLLLDEPTNHLDMDSLLWLENYLKTCPSALLLVSHDRVFLNNVVGRIIEVERGQVVSYAGNYDQYLIEKEKRLTTEAAAYASQQDRIKQVEKFIERNKVRATTAKRAQSRIKMLDKMEKLDAPVRPNEKLRFSLPKPARSPENLVELSGVTKAYGPKVLYKGLDLTIRRGDRLAFLGPNGAGKTTLLKLLAGATDYQAGTRRQADGVLLSYFAQFQLEELNPDRTVLEEIDTVAGDLTPGRLRSILGSFLFRGDDVFKKVAVLSGGEKSRLLLAKIMLVGPNLLLLDEPTNHLDIPAREMLEQALLQYEGTLCLISHDRHLINAVANKVLVVRNGRPEVFPGNFDDFRRVWQDRLDAEDAAARPAHVAVKQVEQPKAQGLTRAEKEARKKAEAQARQKLYRLKAPLEKKVRELEDQVSGLGSQIDAVSAELALPETYQDAEKFKKLHLQYNRLKADLDKASAAWEEAALELEELENNPELNEG